MLRTDICRKAPLLDMLGPAIEGLELDSQTERTLKEIEENKIEVIYEQERKRRYMEV